MIDERTLLLYLPAMIAITIAPGADTLFVLASALRGGVHGGIFAALGVISGGTVHITLAAVGLSALILHSPILFTVLKYGGGAYLIFLGIRTWRERDAVLTNAAYGEQPPSRRTAFARGFVTNVTNPKVAMFVIAFFPQFVSPANGAIWSQMLELGALWYTAGLLWLLLLGIVVGRLRRAVAPSVRFQKTLRYITGSIFIGLGVRVALQSDM